MARRRKKGGSSLLPEIAAPEPGVPRRLRVEGQLHQHLAQALAQLNDPRLASATITRVMMTDDLQLAKVYVRSGTKVAAGEDEQRDLLRGLRSAGGRLRALAGRALGLRYTPQLRFYYDEGPDAAGRVDQILAEIRADGDLD